MWSFSVILLFVLSFCKHRITDERGNGRRPNLAGTGKRWPSRSGWLLVVIRICAWITVFHCLRHWGICDFTTFVIAFLCFLSSHAINSRFEPNLAKWMTPTSVSTIPQFWNRYSTDIQIQINPKIRIRIQILASAEVCTLYYRQNIFN